jgi:hypothetical protein
MKRLLVLGFAAACTSSDPVVDTCDPVLAGSAWDGPNGSTVTIVMTNPTPPARFTNWWAVTVNTPDGAPMIDPARLAVTAFMPEHNHSSPTIPEVTYEPDGLVVGPLDLWMPGQWDIRFDLDRERIVVPVCIDE